MRDVVRPVVDEGSWLARLHTPAALFLVLAAIAGLVGAFEYRDQLRVHRDTQQMYRGLADGLGAVADLQYEIQEARRSLLYALTTTDNTRKIEYVDKARRADARVTTQGGWGGSDVDMILASENGPVLEKVQEQLLRQMRGLDEVSDPRPYPAPPAVELVIRPKTAEAAMKIRGVGEQKAAKWLPEFLEVIKKHAGGK
jgi:hypothetical protein